MKCLPVLLFLFFLQSAHAQYIPDSATVSAEKMAGYLQYTYKDPSTQLQTLYGWITRNIRYDKDSAMYFNWSADHTTKIAATLRRRKGVCENYASLMADIAARLNIRAWVVHGYPSYANGNKDNSHSWVAIQQNDDWFLCDPTWDAQAAAEKYFMLAPADFIQTHIPFDPMWQLLEHPQYYKTFTGKFMYKDSVQTFLAMDSLQQFMATERRIKNTGNQNSMTNNWQRLNRMNIAVIAGEKDEQLYNDAVSALNKANALFNQFVQYRNQQFTPVKPDTEIKNMLQPIAGLLKEAEAQLRKLGSITANYQYDPEMIRQRIATLEKKTIAQQNFLNIYFATAAAERVKLFIQ